MKLIFQHLSYGLGIGSTIYLIYGLLPHADDPRYTPFEIASVLIVSMLIGLLSLIFQTDRISWTLQLVIHAVCTFVLVAAMGLINHWFTLQTMFQNALWSFLLVYVLVWVFLALDQLVTLRQINRRLKERR
ncbi:MAG TPA: hypothetical protein DCW31_06080 [Lactobacillus sp.]|nr:hypothetical protein [Lactobacillus sp.]